MGLTTRCFCQTSTELTMNGSWIEIVNVNGKGVLESFFARVSDTVNCKIKIELDNIVFLEGNYTHLSRLLFTYSSNNPWNIYNNAPMNMADASLVTWYSMNKPFNSKLKISVYGVNNAFKLKETLISYLLEV